MEGPGGGQRVKSSRKEQITVRAFNREEGKWLAVGQERHVRGSNGPTRRPS